MELLKQVVGGAATFADRFCQVADGFAASTTTATLARTLTRNPARNPAARTGEESEFGYEWENEINDYLDRIAPETPCAPTDGSAVGSKPGYDAPRTGWGAGPTNSSMASNPEDVGTRDKKVQRQTSGGGSGGLHGNPRTTANAAGVGTRDKTVQQQVSGGGSGGFHRRPGTTANAAGVGTRDKTVQQQVSGGGSGGFHRRQGTTGNVHGVSTRDQQVVLNHLDPLAQYTSRDWSDDESDDGADDGAARKRKRVDEGQFPQQRGSHVNASDDQGQHGNTDPRVPTVIRETSSGGKEGHNGDKIWRSVNKRDGLLRQTRNSGASRGRLPSGTR